MAEKKLPKFVYFVYIIWLVLRTFGFALMLAQKIHWKGNTIVHGNFNTSHFNEKC